ncbi:fumarylacetoacetate hydrolase domain-containing protein [Trichoderma harzianum]|uniref:Fumarylacetoacetate hydrolase domain-containing protein n=1 Tax=Trichoderma harzianum TaxID=5544 RepID=A0A0F9XYU7_TRIHA|nr:fumarylacetoacetate hydrolase domain-containing protein [Trichoderma harzianum]
MASNPLNISRFTLATLCIEYEPVAAIGVDDCFYLLPDSLLSLKHTTVKDILGSWPDIFPILEQFAQDTRKSQNVSGRSQINLDNAQLLTPILYPNKLVAVGANYSGHLKEMGLSAEKWANMPFFIRPPTTSLVGPGKTVRIPRSTKQFDWECELAVVVGKKLRHASREEAAEGIAGYSIGLDLSCRDLIPAGNELQIDLMRGKAQDTMAPCGPFIVPAKFLPDTADLRIRLSVNDKPMMGASTSEMLYKCDEQLSIVSSYMTLEPGDIVFTGSPSGSAHVHGDCWLKPGDRILAEIEGIGQLEVTMIPDD